MGKIIIPVLRKYNGGTSGYTGYTEFFSSKNIVIPGIQNGDLLTVQYSADGNAIPTIELGGVTNQSLYSRYYSSWGYRSDFTMGARCFVASGGGDGTVTLQSNKSTYWTYQIILWRGPTPLSSWVIRSVHQQEIFTINDSEVVLIHAGHEDWHNEFVWEFTPSGPYQYIYNLRRHDVLYKTLEATDSGTLNLNCSYNVDFFNLIVTCSPQYPFFSTFVLV